MTNNMKRIKPWLIILSLLSLNIVEQAASVITGTIPGMAESFPNESLVNIELITTVVSVFVTVFVLVSGFIVGKIGQKQTAVLGLVIATGSSIIPMFSNDFQVILLSRAILGMGIGLTNPLAISLIGVFFSGEERAKLMGWRSAIAGVGTSIMTYISGQLLNINWHASYGVYLLFVPTLIVFVLFVPNPENSLKMKDSVNKGKVRVNIKKSNSKLLVSVLTVLTFLILIAIMVLDIKLPTYFVDNGIGNATQASNAWSVYNLSSVVGGAFFGYMYKKLHKYILSSGLGLSGLGIVLISIIRNVQVIYLLCIFMGIASALIIPYIFNRISESTSQEKAPLYTSIVLVGSNLGSFLSPYAGELLGKNSRVSILNAGILLIILSFISLLVLVKIKLGKKDRK